jgi:hypothetical protein
MEGYAHDSVGRPRQLGGRGDFDPTPGSEGAQGALGKAHGSAIYSQKPVKGIVLIAMALMKARGNSDFSPTLSPKGEGEKQRSVAAGRRLVLL